MLLSLLCEPGAKRVLVGSVSGEFLTGVVPCKLPQVLLTNLGLKGRSCIEAVL